MRRSTKGRAIDGDRERERPRRGGPTSAHRGRHRARTRTCRDGGRGRAALPRVPSRALPAGGAAAARGRCPHDRRGDRGGGLPAVTDQEIPRAVPLPPSMQARLRALEQQKQIAAQRQIDIVAAFLEGAGVPVDGIAWTVAPDMSEVVRTEAPPELA